MTERRSNIRVELWAQGYIRPVYYATVGINGDVRRFAQFSVASYDRLYQWCARRAESVWVPERQSYVFHVEA